MLYHSANAVQQANPDELACRDLAYKRVFLIDSITFAVSAIAFLMLVGSMPRRHRPAEAAHVAAEAGALPGAAPYLSAIVMLVIGARFVEAFGSGTHNVGFPIRSQLFDANQPAFLYGWLMAVWSVSNRVTSRSSRISSCC